MNIALYVAFLRLKLGFNVFPIVWRVSRYKHAIYFLLKEGKSGTIWCERGPALIIKLQFVTFATKQDTGEF